MDATRMVAATQPKGWRASFSALSYMNCATRLGVMTIIATTTTISNSIHSQTNI